MAEELKFEKAMERLEKIVEDLETGEITLEEALKKYEEGVSLARACQKRLAQAEKKIEILKQSLDGTLEPVPFCPEEGEAVRPSKKTGKKKAEKQESEDGEEDQLI